MICFCCRLETKQLRPIVIGGQHVDITLVLTGFSEMHVFLFAGTLFECVNLTVEGANAYMGESHEVKTVEILVRK